MNEKGSSDGSAEENASSGEVEESKEKKRHVAQEHFEEPARIKNPRSLMRKIPVRQSSDDDEDDEDECSEEGGVGDEDSEGEREEE